MPKRTKKIFKAIHAKYILKTFMAINISYAHEYQRI